MYTNALCLKWNNKEGQNVSIFGIHGNQSSNIIAKLVKCLTLQYKMTNRHKCVDISLYSIRSIDTNLKSCTHASLVLCLNLVSMATWILLLAWNCTFWPFLNDSCWDRKYQKGWILFYGYPLMLGVSNEKI